MQDHFISFHPAVNMLFFALMIFFSLFFRDSLLLGISLAGALAYALYLGRGRALRLIGIYFLPLLLAALLLGQLLSPRGMTDFRADPAMAWEGFYLSLTVFALLGAIFLWIFCYLQLVPRTKLVYLLGSIMPAAALMLAAALRFSALFWEKLRKVAQAQKVLGRDISQGSLWQRIRHVLPILSIMLTWFLENSLETIDSMKARGYGLKGRGSWRIYPFTPRDALVLILLLLLALPALWGIFWGYFILSFLPFLINAGEEIRWRYWKSKI